jgi:hypothetical protein
MVRNVQLAKDIYAAFGRGDIPTVLAAFHPELEWRQAEGNPYQLDGSAWIGPQAVLEKLFIRIGAEWDAAGHGGKLGAPSPTFAWGDRPRKIIVVALTQTPGATDLRPQLMKIVNGEM